MKNECQIVSLPFVGLGSSIMDFFNRRLGSYFYNSTKNILKNKKGYGPEWISTNVNTGNEFFIKTVSLFGENHSTSKLK